VSFEGVRDFLEGCQLYLGVDGGIVNYCGCKPEASGDIATHAPAPGLRCLAIVHGSFVMDPEV